LPAHKFEVDRMYKNIIFMRSRKEITKKIIFNLIICLDLIEFIICPLSDW